jgi:SAM-dependent methyltransferase
MSAPIRSYYEEYWRDAAGSAVEADPLTPSRLAIFARHVRAPARVLDAGCGSGRTTEALRRAGYDAVGVELSHTALSLAPAAAFPRIRCAVDAPLPFRDATFDAVYCAEVLEHLFDPALAVSELHRVLRPGGKIVASVPFHGRLKNLLIAAAAFDTHFDPRGQHIRFFSRRTFRKLFEGAGFRAIASRPIGRFWPVYMNMVLTAERSR